MFKHYTFTGRISYRSKRVETTDKYMDTSIQECYSFVIPISSGIFLAGQKHSREKNN